MTQMTNVKSFIMFHKSLRVFGVFFQSICGFLLLLLFSFRLGNFYCSILKLHDFSSVTSTLIFSPSIEIFCFFWCFFVVVVVIVFFSSIISLGFFFIVCISTSLLILSIYLLRKSKSIIFTWFSHVHNHALK